MRKGMERTFCGCSFQSDEHEYFLWLILSRWDEVNRKKKKKTHTYVFSCEIGMGREGDVETDRGIQRKEVQKVTHEGLGSIRVVGTMLICGCYVLQHCKKVCGVLVDFFRMSLSCCHGNACW